MFVFLDETVTPLSLAEAIFAVAMLEHARGALAFQCAKSLQSKGQRGGPGDEATRTV